MCLKTFPGLRHKCGWPFVTRHWSDHNRRFLTYVDPAVVTSTACTASCFQLLLPVTAIVYKHRVPSICLCTRVHLKCNIQTITYSTTSGEIYICITYVNTCSDLCMLYPLQMAISLNSQGSHFLFTVVHTRPLDQGSSICACDYFHLH